MTAPSAPCCASGQRRRRPSRAAALFRAEAPSTTAVVVGRRPALVSAVAAVLSASPSLTTTRFARAGTLVDQIEAEAVFSAANAWVASIRDYEVQADGVTETFEGVGSGLVWDSLGHIVTNYHWRGGGRGELETKRRKVMAGLFTPDKHT